jgi:hypothetical protein
MGALGLFGALGVLAALGSYWGKSFFHGSVSLLKNSSSFGKLTAK